jgi:predicted regulator of Ras-like GTPase activity (Roadblock/LC7/MglB family)
MSAVKIKFAGLLRGLLRHFDDDEPVAVKAFEPSAPAVPAVTAAPEAVPPSLVSQKPVPSLPASVPSPASAGADGIELPLQPILAGLPMELRAKITGSGTAGITILIPVEKVLTQLATGSVKISFGELRHLAPGVFVKYGGEHDSKSVALPLNQILAQINPALLARRSAQRRVEISDEVASPFDARGEGLKITTDKLKSRPGTPPPSEPPPLSRFAAPPPEPPLQPLPVVPPPAFTPRWTTPAPSASNGSNGNGSSNGFKNGDSNGLNGSYPSRPAGFDMPLTAAVPKTGSTPQAPVEQPVLAPLAALSENWPDALKLEIAQLDLANAQVSLPVNLIEPALKRGRVLFAWRDLRSWIKSVAVAVSVHDGVELELPLKILAPLYFARLKSGATGQKKVSVTDEIPNLFFGFPQPAAAPLLAAPSAVAAAIPLPETNFFSRSIQPPTSDSEFKRKGGTDFKSRGSTPAEIITRAMELPGVAGAVIALPDGLKVASRIPPDLNGDTLAAFLPQIFTRVNQCSRELRMGDLNNLSFTIGSVPWKIFRVNAVYFAAFGRGNEPLPGAPLAALAVELDHKK